MEASLSQGALHAGNIVDVVSDLPQDGQVSGLTRHTLEADVGLEAEEVTSSLPHTQHDIMKAQQ